MIDPRAADRTVLAAVAIAVGQVSNALGAAWSKSLFPVVGPEGVVALRLGFCALLLGLVTRVWRLRVPRANWWELGGYGLCLGVMNSVAYQAFARIPIGIGMSIEVVGPLSLVLLHSRRARDFVWLVSILLGLGLLLYPQAGIPPLDPVGVAFSCCSATCWAGYIVFGRRVSRLGGSAIAAAGAIIASSFVLPFGLITAGASLENTSVLMLGFAIAVLSSVIPYLLQLLALRQLTAGIYGLIASSMPAMGALMSWLVLGEQLGLRQWFGIVLVVFAAGGCTFNATRSAQR